MGKDPTDVAGYDLTAPLLDFDGVLKQGINGAIWALIALDSGDYVSPDGLRQKYVDEIVSRRLSDGGWALTAVNGSDPDVTAMALTALAPYRAETAVKAAIDGGLAYLSSAQLADGGYSSWGTENCDSTAQVMIALATLGISLSDERFAKNGKTTLDALLTYQLSDGSFAHVKGGETSEMSTQQALLALAAADRAEKGMRAVYAMGLEKNPQVAVPEATVSVTFQDVTESPAVEALAARKIVDGYEDGTFRPEQTLTRAEFAAIVTRALGLAPNVTGAFTDVPTKKWYAGYVDTAAAFGIVNGVGGGKFSPDGTITRREAAVMVARAAALCGMDTTVTVPATATWSSSGMAFCLKFGIIDTADEPLKAVTRSEMADMIYKMLRAAELI
jgi:hypothetical protein